MSEGKEVERIETQVEAVSSRLSELILRFETCTNLVDDSLDRSVGSILEPESDKGKSIPSTGVMGSIFHQLERLEDIESHLRGKLHRVQEII